MAYSFWARSALPHAIPHAYPTNYPTKNGRQLPPVLNYGLSRSTSCYVTSSGRCETYSTWFLRDIK